MIGFLIGGGVIFLALTSIGYLWNSYNYLISGKQNIKAMWGNIRVEYQRRADLLYNLMAEVKGYEKFEKETLTAVIAMRSGNFGKEGISEIKNMKKLDNVLSRLLVVFERYPELKTGKLYHQLMEETRITEDRIVSARVEYNDTIRDYNMSVVSFPRNIIARMWGFEEFPYFEGEQENEKAPRFDEVARSEVKKIK